MKEKTPLSYGVVRFQMLDFETSNSKSDENDFFLEYVTSEGAVSHIYSPHYSLIPTKVYANNYYE